MCFKVISPKVCGTHQPYYTQPCLIYYISNMWNNSIVCVCVSSMTRQLWIIHETEIELDSKSNKLRGGHGLYTVIRCMVQMHVN